jgi:hypothetical protein
MASGSFSSQCSTIDRGFCVIAEDHQSIRIRERRDKTHLKFGSKKPNGFLDLGGGIPAMLSCNPEESFGFGFGAAYLEMNRGIGFSVGLGVSPR